MLFPSFHPSSTSICPHIHNLPKPPDCYHQVACKWRGNNDIVSGGLISRIATFSKHLILYTVLEGSSDFRSDGSATSVLNDKVTYKFSIETTLDWKTVTRDLMQIWYRR